MRPFVNALLRHWHGMLGLTRQAPASWYRARLEEELEEVQTAPTKLLRLSETSDVFFTIIRAKCDGFTIQELPPFMVNHVLVYAYMLGKFTSRWAFYRVTAFLCNAPHYREVREVVNPGKDDKLEAVASRHQIDPEKFKRVGRQLRRVWPLLP